MPIPSRASCAPCASWRHAGWTAWPSTGRIWPARLTGAVPAATRDLPSAVLGEAGGGPIPVAPAAPGEPALQALQPVLLLDLTVPGLPLQRVGTRAWVRLELGYAPLAQQLYQQASQVFLQHAGRS
mgnify:CR=1 FL=1